MSTEKEYTSKNHEPTNSSKKDKGEEKTHPDNRKPEVQLDTVHEELGKNSQIPNKQKAIEDSDNQEFKRVSRQEENKINKNE